MIARHWLGSNHPAVRRPENIVLARAAGTSAGTSVTRATSSCGLPALGVGGTVDSVPRSILADAFAHHSWATLRLIDACTVLSSAQLTSPVPGTYGPIVDTLRHIVGADRSYLALLSGDRVTRVDESDLDLGAMRAVIEENEPLWQTLVAGELDTDEVIVRHRDDGSESHAPLGIRLAQVVHHGTDHRSQICTAMTNLGVEPPSIDVWDFADARGRLREVVPQ